MNTVTMSRRQLVVGLAAGTVVACTVNPVTGRSQLMLVSDAQLQQMSAGAWDEAKAQEPVSHDPQLNARLERVGGKVAAAAGMGGERLQHPLAVGVSRRQ